jgi:phosphoribosyl 1,2-cyclic phosphodiesterase
MKSFILSSGSSANCFYVEFDKSERFLVDIGLSFKKTKEFLEEKDINIDDINSIFITHEHNDHINGFLQFYKKLNCIFYMSKGTFEEIICIFNIDRESLIKRTVFVSEGNKISFDFGEVFVFSKSHDAKEPLWFVFKKNSSLGILTDFGYIDKKNEKILQNLDYLYIEANYSDEILNNVKNNFPPNYVNRLRSNFGHLSLEDCSFFLNNYGKFIKKIVICHISENTNNYEKVYLTLKKSLKNFQSKLYISFQGKPTDWVIYDE